MNKLEDIPPCRDGEKPRESSSRTSDVFKPTKKELEEFFFKLEEEEVDWELEEEFDWDSDEGLCTGCYEPDLEHFWFTLPYWIDDLEPGEVMNGCIETGTENVKIFWEGKNCIVIDEHENSWKVCTITEKCETTPTSCSCFKHYHWKCLPIEQEERETPCDEEFMRDIST